MASTGIVTEVSCYSKADRGNVGRKYVLKLGRAEIDADEAVAALFTVSTLWNFLLLPAPLHC